MIIKAMQKMWNSHSVLGPSSTHPAGSETQVFMGTTSHSYGQSVSQHLCCYLIRHTEDGSLLRSHQPTSKHDCDVHFTGWLTRTTAAGAALPHAGACACECACGA